MRKAIVRLTVVVAILAPCAAVLGQPTPSAAMEEDIRELMEVTGAGNLAVQVIQQLLGPMRRSMPNVPEEFWTRFVAQVDTGALVDITVPIYAKHFTHDEIKQLLAFYQTPLGRKLIATLPAVAQESMVAGREWGEGLARQVLSELEVEGYR